MFHHVIDDLSIFRTVWPTATYLSVQRYLNSDCLDSHPVLLSPAGQQTIIRANT